MTNYYRCLVSGIGLVGLSSCGVLYKKPQIINPYEQDVQDISEEDAIGVGALDGGGTFKAKFSKEELSDIYENVVFAPENPEEEFNPISEQAAKSLPAQTWTTSFKTAIQQSRETGHPLLIWFSDSRGSMNSRLLSEELFSKNDFNKWVSSRYSTLLIDKPNANDPNLGKQELYKAQSDYKKLRNRFSVHGTPEVLVIDFSSQVHARYRGYKSGDATFYWGQLKAAHRGAVKTYNRWKNGMEKRGFRMWHSADEQNKKFAKMLSFSDGIVTLVTPEGKRVEQPLIGFSRLDKKWVTDQQDL